MTEIMSALSDHAFERLFVELLGWDRFRSSVVVSPKEMFLEITGVAQKRGLAVFIIRSHRTVLANRGFLRRVQRCLRVVHHEHILIHYSETPRKQVWQWSTIAADGRRIVHSEHPFFSNHPPPRLVERIKGLEIGLAEEETTDLSDVLSRVRLALSPGSDFNLFARYPTYAAESDRLAMAMRRGKPGAFSRFVEFHMRLATYSAKTLYRWFAIDPEDYEQIALLGLVQAAHRFDPERGYQFSTYASHWIRQACHRFGLVHALTIRIPPHVFWPCYRISCEMGRRTHGRNWINDLHPSKKLLDKHGVSLRNWERFIAAQRVVLATDLEPTDVLYLRSLPEATVEGEQEAGLLRQDVDAGLSTLAPRDAIVLRLRYGLDGFPMTLEEVGEQLGVTRERVRQIQARAEDALHSHWEGSFFGPDKVQSSTPSSQASSERDTDRPQRRRAHS
jgi:RNA polymerase primary sigma factor